MAVVGPTRPPTISFPSLFCTDNTEALPLVPFEFMFKESSVAKTGGAPGMMVPLLEENLGTGSDWRVGIGTPDRSRMRMGSPKTSCDMSCTHDRCECSNGK